MTSRRRRLEPLGGGPQLAGAGLGQQHRELVPAEAAEHVGGPQVGGERGRDAAQQRVARRVALGVVDGLEVVEVDHDQPERAPVVAHVVGQLRLEALGEAAAVEAAGQRVRAREPRQLAPLALAVGGLGDAHHRAGDEQRGEDPDRVGLGSAREQRRDRRRRARTSRRRSPPSGAGRRARRRSAAGRRSRTSGLREPPSALTMARDQREVAGRPGEEEVLAPARAHDRGGRQPGDHVGAHQRARRAARRSARGAPLSHETRT